MIDVLSGLARKLQSWRERDLHVVRELSLAATLLEQPASANNISRAQYAVRLAINMIIEGKPTRSHGEERAHAD